MRQLLIALACTLAMPALAAPADFRPALTAKGRPAARVAQDAGRKPAEVLDFLGLKRGDVALDFFAGGGYYSEIMAKAVGPKGIVVAHEVPGFYRDDKAKAEWAALRKRAPNVRFMLLPIQNFDAAPNSFDFAMLHLVYHDLYWQSEKFGIPRMEPDTMLARLYRSIKPGGIVGVVDHAGAPGDTRALVEAQHRIDPETVKADFQRAGFVLEGESAVLRVPADDLTVNVFDPKIRGKTDRFVFKFRKPA